MVIALLAVLIYLGINYSAAAMDRNVSSYYIDRNEQDITILSPLLLTEEDLQAIRELDGVADAEGSDQTTAWLLAEEKNYELSVLSLAERIAVPEIVEGRAPQTAQECMLEQKLAMMTGMQIGDRIRLTGADPDMVPPLMSETEFTITGLFTHPDHLTDYVSYDYYVIVTEDAFDQNTLEGNWPRVRVTLSDLPDNRFSKAYWKKISPVEELLKELSAERSPIRYEQVRETYETKISDGEAQLEEAKAKLTDADQQLRDAEVQLLDAEAQIADGEQQLADGEAKLRDAEAQIADGEQELQENEQKLLDGEVELRNAEVQLADAEVQLADGEQRLAEAEAELRDAEAQITDGEQQLADGERRIQEGEQQLADGEAKLRDAEAQIADGEQQLAEGEQKLTEAEAQLRDAEAQIADGEQQLQDGEAELRDAEAQITDGERQLAEGEQKLADGEAELRDAEAQIADGERQLAEGEQKLADGEAELRDAEAQIADGELQLQEAEAAAADSMDELEKGRAALEEAERLLGLAPGQLAAGEAKLRDAEEKLEAGKDDLDQGREDLALAEEFIYDGYDWMKENNYVPTPDDISYAKEISEKFDVDVSSVPDAFPEDFLSWPEDKAIRWLKDNLGNTEAEQCYRDGLKEYLEGLAEYEKGRNDYYYQGEQYLDGLTAYEKGKKAIEEAEKKLQALADARALLEEKKQELEAGRQELEAGRQELEDKRAELKAGKEEYEAGRQKLEEGRQELEDKRAELESGKEEYEAGRQKLEEGKEKLEASKKEYEAGKEEYEAGKQELEEKRAELEAGKQELEAGREKLETGRRELEAGRQELEEGKKEYEAGKQELEEKRAELLDAKQQVEDARAEFEEKKQEYEEGLQTYEDSRTLLDTAREELGRLKAGAWYMMDNNSDICYAFSQANSGNLASLSNTFSLMFIIVAALVIYASVGRMVDEQSILVGTTKALGLYNREVLTKYMVFGIFSTLGGALLGILLAWCLLQPLLLNMYAPYYNLERAQKCFLLLPSIIVALGSLLLSILSVWLACNRLLKRSARDLMAGVEPVKDKKSKKPKKKNKEPGKEKEESSEVAAVSAEAAEVRTVPAEATEEAAELLTAVSTETAEREKPEKEKKKKEKKSSGSLYARLIILNMTSDLKRVIVTTVSIAGCCMLLLIGFMLRNGQTRIIDRQYRNIQTYDAELVFDPSVETAESELAGILDELGVEYTLVCREERLFSHGDFLSGTQIVVAEPGTLSGFFNLRDGDSEKDIDVQEHGLLVPLRLHEDHEINPGTAISLYDDTMTQFVAEVTGIYNTYRGRVFYLSDKAYHEIFSENAVPNCFFVKLNGKGSSDLIAAVHHTKGYLTITDIETELMQLEEVSSAMGVLVIIMIVIAGLMAFFILMNLSGSYMIHKKKELTIMRINGYTAKECIRYAATELIVTTILGILIGLLIGTPLGYWIQLMMEMPDSQLVRGVNVGSILLSILITAIFSLIINSLALNKVKTLKLSDI